MQHPFRGRGHKSPQESLFLSLPPEIRNRIYKIAFVNPTPIDFCLLSYIHHEDDIWQDIEMD